MFLSVFDVFKIGIGPSSSHTMGPMSAAARFLSLILSSDWPRPVGASVASIAVSLHGSLAHTGIGHGSGRAVILGLMGEVPHKVDPDRMDTIIETVERLPDPPCRNRRRHLSHRQLHRFAERRPILHCGGCSSALLVH